MVRRADLAEFLRAKRSVIAPGDVGLAPGQRRRTAGLRREEVAQLAGVSVSWYTWLEQGRPINASKDVLDALARALRLDPVERDHLLALAASDRRAGTITQPTVPESLHRLLGALEPNPSYVLGPTWDFLAWNDAYVRLFPVITTLSPAERNLVWIVFADPTARALIVDWNPKPAGYCHNSGPTPRPTATILACSRSSTASPWRAKSLPHGGPAMTSPAWNDEFASFSTLRQAESSSSFNS